MNFDKRVIEVEDDLRIVFIPHEGQKKVLYALLFQLMALVFVQCGRKFGKTDLAIYCLYWFAMVFDGCEVYYIADTMKHASEIVWENRRLPDFLRRVRRRKQESSQEFEARKREAQKKFDKWVLKVNESKMKIYLKNGSIIGVDGAENYANADGIEPQLVVYDELKHHDTRYHEAMEPNMDVYNGSILAIGTPPDTIENNYCDIARDAKIRDDGAFFQMPSFLNGILYPDGENDVKFQKIIQRYKNRGDIDVLMREYYGEIVIGGGGSIFPMFRPRPVDEHGRYCGYSKHVWKHDDLMIDVKRNPKDWEFFCAFDPGSATCFAVLMAAIHIKTNSVVFLDEIYATDQRKTSTKQVFPIAVQKMMDIYPDMDAWTLHYDNAALWFFTEVQSEYSVCMMPCVKDLKNKENKLGQIKDVMLADLFFMSDRCENLSKEMANYVKDKNGRIPKENDHLIDCMRYIFNAANYDFTKLPEPEKIDQDDIVNVSAIEDFIEYSKKNSLNIGYDDIIGEFYD